MKVYRATEFDTTEVRAHPYDPSLRATYYDFKKNPDLISSVLADFKPWATFSGVRRFYELLRWLNGPESALESNDCGYLGPGRNTENPELQKRLRCTGRLMIFYRDLRLNTNVDKLVRLVEIVSHCLEKAEPELDFAVVGISLYGCHYLELGEGEDARGGELCLTFWSWGDSRKEVMRNFDWTVQAMTQALAETSEIVRNSESSLCRPERPPLQGTG